MYQQQVEPEHGYTTYIMRSLRSPPAHKVPKHLGKLEIERKKFEKIKFLNHCIARAIQELQDGWSSKDLTSAVSFFCQFHATGGDWNRNTDIRLDGRLITNANIKVFITGWQNPLKLHTSLPALGPHVCRPGDGNDDVVDGNEVGGVVVVDDDYGDHHVDKAMHNGNIFSTTTTTTTIPMCLECKINIFSIN